MQSVTWKTICLLTLPLITILFLGCNGSDTSTVSQLADSPLPDKAKYNNELRLQVDGEEVFYSLYLPENLAEEKPVPLILVLHDGGGRHAGAKDAPGRTLRDLAVPGLAELGAIMIAPHSGETDWTSERNQKVIDRLIEKITDHYPIDTNRTLVMGFSMGGFGSWYYAEHREDFFKIAIPVAGRPLSERTEWTNAIYIIHSNDDQQVPIEPSKAYFEKLRAAGIRIEASFLDGLGHFQVFPYSDHLQKAVPWILETWDTQ